MTPLTTKVQIKQWKSRENVMFCSRSHSYFWQNYPKCRALKSTQNPEFQFCFVFFQNSILTTWIITSDWTNTKNNSIKHIQIPFK